MKRALLIAAIVGCGAIRGATGPAEITREEVRAEWQQLVPALAGIAAAPASPAGAWSRWVVTVDGSAKTAAAPEFELADNRYRRVALADLARWLDRLAALRAAAEGREANAARLDRGRAARLLRVWAAAEARRRGGDAAPAIGWCRLRLRESWAGWERGEVRVFALVAVADGWIAVDPFTRVALRLEPGAAPWAIEALAL